jgi:hypothetical protein
LIASARAAGRAVQYRRAIAELQASGQHRAALAEAIRWLRSEVGHYVRRHPRDEDVLCRQLTDRITTLAAAVAEFEPVSSLDRRRQDRNRKPDHRNGGR